MQPYRKFTNASSGGVPGLSNAAGGTAIADNVIIRGDGTTGIQGSNGRVTDSGVITTGGITSAFAGIKDDGFGQLQVRHGDDSSYAPIITTQFEVNNSAASLRKASLREDIFALANDVPISYSESTSASGTKDSGILRTTAGVLKITDGSTGLGWLQTAGFKRKTADQTVTNSTTLVDDSHLTVSLAAGRSYKFKFVLFASVRTGNQVKVCLSGTATHTHLISSAKIYDSSTLLMDLVDVVINTTPGNHLYVSNTLPTDEALIEIEGTTTVNAAGTFLLQFAEVTAGIGSDVILRRGSTLEVWDVA